MQNIIKCTSCGIDLAVDQPSANGVYCCPSCGVNFQIAATPPPPPQIAPAPMSAPAPRNTPALAPGLNPGPMAAQQPAAAWRPGQSSLQPQVVVKSSDKTVWIVVGSIAALAIICFTIVTLVSGKSQPPPVAQTVQTPPKLTVEDRRKEIEQQAKDMLDASASAIEREIEEAKEEQKAFDEAREERRKELAEMYGERFFDGDEEAGYQLVVEIEGMFDMMLDSEEEAQEYLQERIEKNPVLKPYIAKLDGFPFTEKNKGAMAHLREYKSFGTGFFVTDNGWIVTNRHVVGKAKVVDVRISDGTTHRAQVVKVDEDFDLALVKVETKAPKSLPISKGAKEMSLGREVFTIGFPNPVMQGVEPKYTDGKVSATAGMEDDKNFYQVSVPVQPGNSGGALVDAATGWCVGVVTLRLENTADGRSAQNVSYAIKSSALHGFIERFNKSGSHNIEIAATKPPTPEGSIELAKNAAVQILVPRKDPDAKEKKEEE
jgi:serine protease Do